MGNTEHKYKAVRCYTCNTVWQPSGRPLKDTDNLLAKEVHIVKFCPSCRLYFLDYGPLVYAEVRANIDREFMRAIIELSAYHIEFGEDDCIKCGENFSLKDLSDGRCPRCRPNKDRKSVV